MKSQENFGSYLNKLFFNTFSKSPDSSVVKFLNNFAPILLHEHQPKNNESWTVYPPEKLPTSVIVTHSYIFANHPFLNIDFKQGEFKVYTKQYNDSQYATGVQNIQIILSFEKLDEAINLFEKLRGDLLGLAKEHNYYEDDFKKNTKFYSDENMYDIPCGVRISLQTNGDINNWYQLIIGID